MLTKDDILLLKENFATREEHNDLKKDLDLNTRELVRFIGEVHKDLKNDISHINERLDKILNELSSHRTRIDKVELYKEVMAEHELRIRILEQRFQN